MKHFFLLIVIAFTILVASCGGSGGSDSSIPPVRPTGTLSGLAYDGPIAGGTVSAYRWDNGRKGGLVGSAITNSLGEYTLDVSTTEGFLLLEITGGSYLEEASGTVVTLSPKDKLSTLIFYENGAVIDAQITHFTHWASCLAAYLLDNTSLALGNAIIQSSEILSDIAQVPITATKPVDITRPDNINPNLTLNHQYGYLLAAISEVTAELSRLNNAKPHSLSLYTSIHFASLVCSDIQYDGLMDGKAAPSDANPTGQVYMGTAPLNVDVYRSLLAESILGIAHSDINKAGFTSQDLLSFANKISLNRNGIFPNVEPTGVDLTSPTVIAEKTIGSTLAGETILQFSVSDPLGIESIEFYLNGNFYQTGDVTNPQMRIATHDYPDGDYTITVNATDQIGNQGSNDFIYSFLNTAPAINLTSSDLVNASSYLITGTADTTVGMSQVQINLNDQVINADISDNQWSATVNLSLGTNNIVVTATDAIGNINNIIYEVGFDNNAPLIGVLETGTTFSDGSGQLNLCTYGQLNDEVAVSVPICLSTSNLHLNGTPVTIALPNIGYVIAGFEIDDVSSGGIFTTPELLNAEYRYLKNGLEIMNWTSAPRQTGLLIDTIFIPFTTEYLGNTFFNTSTDTLHVIELRVIDAAGNTSTRQFSFKLDVIVPNLAITSDLRDSLFNTPYSERANVSGRKVIFTHTIDNSNGPDIIIQLDAANDHTFSHHYNGVLRENFGRYKYETKWQGKYTYSESWIDTQFLLAGSQFIELWPTTEYSETAAYTTENPPTSETPWEPIRQPNGVQCSTNISRGTRVGDFWINGTRTPSCRIRLDGSYEVFLREKKVSTYEPEDGYPKNKIVPYHLERTFQTNNIRVFNLNRKQEIQAFNNKYSIPQGDKIIIEVSYLIPEFLSNMDNFTDLKNVAYFYDKETFYDTELEWIFDTTLVINKAINLNNNHQQDLMATSSQTVGRQQTNFKLN